MSNCSTGSGRAGTSDIEERLSGIGQRGRGLVEIDVTPYLGKTEKVNVTLPGIVIRKIDAYVSLHGIKSRSAFLANAAIEKLGLK